MRKLVNQVEVLQQQGAHGSGALPGAGVVDGSAIGSGIGRLLIVADGTRGLIVGNHDDGP